MLLIKFFEETYMGNLLREVLKKGKEEEEQIKIDFENRKKLKKDEFFRNYYSGNFQNINKDEILQKLINNIEILSENERDVIYRAKEQIRNEKIKQIHPIEMKDLIKAYADHYDEIEENS